MQKLLLFFKALCFTSLFLGLSPTFSNAQAIYNSDSLLAACSQLPAPRNVDTLIFLAEENLYNDAAFSEKAAKLALKRAKMRSLKDRTGVASRHLANAQILLGDYKQAFANLKKAKQILEETGNRIELARCLTAIGAAYHETYSYEEAMENLEKALELQRKVQDYNGIALTKNQVGAILMDKEDYQSALPNFKEGLNYISRAKMPEAEVQVELLKNVGEAFRALENIDSAVFYLHEAMRQARHQRLKNTEGRVINILGNIYEAQENYERASLFYEEARRLCQESGFKNGESEALFYIGRIYRKEGRFEEALEHLDLAFEQQKHSGKGLFLYTLNLEYAEVYARTQEFERAFQRMQEAHALKISLDKNDWSRRLAEIQAQHALSRVEKEMEAMRTKNAEEERKNLTYAAVAFGLIAIVIAGLSVYNYHQHRRSKLDKILIEKQKEEIQQKNKKLNQQNARLAETNQEKNHAIRLISHDLKAPLNRIRGLAELIELENHPLSPTQGIYLSTIEQVTDDGLYLIHRLLDIRAIEDDDLNLQKEYFPLCEQLQKIQSNFSVQAQKKQIAIELSCEPKLTAYSDVFYLGRVMDNLLSNAVKFSPEGSTVHLVAEEQRHSVRIHVIDEGPGISIEDQSQLFSAYRPLSARPTGEESSTGLGLSIVQRLVARLGGEVICMSQLGQGTTFTVLIPKDEEGIHPVSQARFAEISRQHMPGIHKKDEKQSELGFA